MMFILMEKILDLSISAISLLSDYMFSGEYSPFLSYTYKSVKVAIVINFEILKLRYIC